MSQTRFKIKEARLSSTEASSEKFLFEWRDAEGRCKVDSFTPEGPIIVGFLAWVCIK